MEWQRKGFTLVELLVVIAIIALLMGILMPALAKVRQIAYRLYCGTNLSGIGKAMLIYANDYDDELPKGGLRNASYVPSIPSWQGPARNDAFLGDKANIACNFYLLIKYAEVTPKSFLCKGDSGVGEFKPSTYVSTGVELVDLWDFGPSPQAHCSYAYHYPYGQFALTTSSEPGMAVAGDPNPWQDTPGALAKDATRWAEFINGTDRESVKAGNAQTHQEDAQNILFMDGHTSAEKTSHCGVDDDNVYTPWTGAGAVGTGKTNGRQPPFNLAAMTPMDRTDSWLVTDGATSGTTGKGRLCFPGDTIVWVDGEMKQISEVSAGSTVDKPAATPAIAGMRKTVCAHEIEDIDVHDDLCTWDRYDVTLETGNTLVVADSHYFLLDSGKWVLVQKLASGSKLSTLDGSVAVKSIEKGISTGTVYNLKIKNAERYLVGKDGIIVRDW